jgi:hypothetical protein
MYTIEGINHKKYRCYVQIQDGVETWIEEGLDRAIDGVVNAARVMNGTIITRKDIRFSGHNVEDETSRNTTIQKRKDLIWDIRQAIGNFREAMQGTFRGVQINDAEKLYDELKSTMDELESWMPDRNVSFDSVISQVESEFRRATSLHGSFNSTHEGYAIIQEEVDELWDGVKANHDCALLKEEAIQIAAMAIRFCVDL